MATHSSALAWRIPGMGAWWAAVSEVTHSRTRLNRLSSRVFVVAHGTFDFPCSMQTLVCGTYDLDP